jgi:solute carrier family 25 citrate transporter 1
MGKAQIISGLECRNEDFANKCNTAGLAAGVTEAVAVVTPMEVIKIRLQAQHHSMADPLDIPKYRNAAHCLYTVIKEEGPLTLWRGVSLTALRQGTNQAGMFYPGTS